MINVNNEFFQNSMINARKDNDDWSTAYDVVKEVDGGNNPSQPFEFAIDIATVEAEASYAEVYSISCDKTFDEILGAYSAGRRLDPTVTITYTAKTTTTFTLIFTSCVKMESEINGLFITGIDSNSGKPYYIVWADGKSSGAVEETNAYAVEIAE